MPKAIDKKPSHTASYFGDDRSTYNQKRNLFDTKKRVKNSTNRREYNKAHGIIDARTTFNTASDISPIPECKNPERREATKHNFKLYCEVYHPRKFYLQWSKDHLELMEIMQTSVLRGGGMHCFACFRGMGKTSLAETLLQWGMLHGHVRYGVIIAATGEHSTELVANFVLELETNPLLYDDFPEVSYPLRDLDRSYKRAILQHCDGIPTRITCKKNKFVFPTVKDSKSSGSILKCSGITGAIRGLKHTTAEGDVIRPDIVLIDDPQTDTSAKSDSLTASRERIINGAINGLAGPNRIISAVMPCTVIRSGDLADRFLDRDKKPEWQGIRTELMPKFPDNMELWKQYNDIRIEGLKAGLGIKPATDFYRVNREAMDIGAVVSWYERYDPRIQLSAIQSAMDLYYADPIAFWSEYQNKPLIESNQSNSLLVLVPQQITERVSNIPYRTVPHLTQYVTTGVDIQQKIIYYLTVAWSEDFGGVIVDYGTYPKQPYWDGWIASKPIVSMERDTDGNEISLGPRIYNGLMELRDNVFSKGFVRESTGAVVFNDKILIDSNWALSADSVHAFCTQAEASAVYLPAYGRGVGANMIPMEQWAKKLGEKRYWNARVLPHTQHANRGKHATFDNNTWKSLIAERLLADMGSPQALKLYGDTKVNHRSLAEQLCSEEAEAKKGKGRYVDEWTIKEKYADNHLWDCLIMSAVAANIAGLQPHNMTISIDGGKGVSAPVPLKKRRVADAPPA